VDPGERSLMSAGACGAFVHGLEDEYLEVRSAAVHSMCRLGMQSHAFAAQCVDFLVDMFNDEIQSVRLSAINSLRQVSATIQLRADQMETVLGVLEESSAEIREAMHSLLCSCQITTIPALRTTIHDLLDNLKKYPCDRESIWRYITCTYLNVV
jgi:integrator complex subunit 4